MFKKETKGQDLCKSNHHFICLNFAIHLFYMQVKFSTRKNQRNKPTDFLRLSVCHNYLTIQKKKNFHPISISLNKHY